MVDTELLKEKINDSGMTMTSFARKTGILRETMYNRMAKEDFKASEIDSITTVLRLTRTERDAIFFAKTVN